MRVLRRPLGSISAALIVAGLSGAVFVSSASAEVDVTGQADAVELAAHEASVEDALNALGAAFEVRHRSAVALAQIISGTYRGPLRHVIARLLDQYDYVTTGSGGAIEIVIFGAHGSAARAALSKAPSAPTQAAVEPPKAPASALRQTGPSPPQVTPGTPSQAAAPVVAPWPPPPPPNQNPVVGMLDSIARSQIPASGPAVPGTVPQASAEPTSPSVPAAQSDLAQTMRNATSALDSLRSALSKLPK